MEGLGPSEVPPPPRKNNKTTYPTCPQQNKRFRANLGPQPETGANENFANLWPHMRKYSVSCACTDNFLNICPFQNTSEQNCSNLCLAHSHQKTKNPWMDPPWTKKKTIFLAFFEMPSHKISNHHQTFKNVRRAQQKSKPEIFKINNFKQIRKCPKRYFEHFHLTPSLPPQSSETLFL